MTGSSKKPVTMTGRQSGGRKVGKTRPVKGNSSIRHFWAVKTIERRWLVKAQLGKAGRVAGWLGGGVEPKVQQKRQQMRESED